MSTNPPRALITCLPAEIILTIAEPLDIRNLNSLLLTSRYLASVLQARFYRLAAKFTFDDKDRRKSPLVWAAEHGRLSAVQKLLDAGAVVTTVLGGYSPFHCAVQNGHTDVARLLLHAGADPNQAASDGDIPLVSAARLGHADIVYMLLEGSNVADKMGRSSFERALFLALSFGHLRIVLLILDIAVVKPERSDSGGSKQTGWIDLAKDERLIYEAARTGNCDMIRLLFDYGVKIPPVHRRSHHPLVIAAQNGHREAVRVMIETGADDNKRDQPAVHGRTIQSLVDSGASSHTTSIIGTPQGHSETARVFQKYGRDLNQLSSDLRTPLQIALEEFSPPNVIHTLLGMGADINLKGRGGSTALHTLIRLKRRDLLETLLSAGASLATVDDKGNTPLLLAVSEFNVEAVSLFLHMGAKTSDRDNMGRTPLHIAATHNSDAILVMLLNAGADVSAMDNHARSPFHFATLSDNPSIFKAILGKHGNLDVDYHVRSRSGRTMLEMAAEGGHLALVNILLQRGCNVMSNHGGYSALHSAVANKRPDVAEALLAHGADPLRLDYYGRTPYDWAAADSEMLNTLLQGCNVAYRPTEPKTRLRVLKNSIVRFATQVLDGQTDNLYKLAKCLVYLGDGDAALVAFAQAAKSRVSEDDLRYPMACSVCRSRLKSSGRSEFMVLVCRRCHDLDLCNWGDGPPFLGFSSNAGFSVDPKIPAVDSDGNQESWEQLLHQLIATYSGPVRDTI